MYLTENGPEMSCCTQRRSPGRKLLRQNFHYQVAFDIRWPYPITDRNHHTDRVECKIVGNTLHFVLPFWFMEVPKPTIWQRLGRLIRLSANHCPAAAGD
jgi:hypothetical protein